MSDTSRSARMIRLARWIATVAVLCSAVTIGVAATSPRTPDSPMKWAADHKGALPKTLAEVAAYPSEYRSWIFTKEPDAIRLTMIRQHITDLLASTRIQWSNEQRQFLIANLDLANRAQHFSDLPVSCNEVQRLFPQGPMRDAVRTVGTETAATYRVLSLAVLAKLAGRQMIGWIAPVAVRAEEEEPGTPYCNCHDSACDCAEPLACDLERTCIVPQEGMCHAATFLCVDAHVCDGYTKHCYGPQ